MGLFDRLKSATAPQFTPQRAVMTIVIAAIKADGEISNEEIGRLRSICARSPIFAQNSKEEDDRLIEFANAATDALRETAVAHAAASLSAELRETAFAFACDMLLADGVITSAEERYVSALAKKLSLHDDLIEAIALVTVIRNRSL